MSHRLPILMNTFLLWLCMNMTAALNAEGLQKKEVLDQEKPVARQINHLIAELNHRDHAIRSRAAEHLRQIGKPALPALAKAAAQGSLEQRHRAAQIHENIIKNDFSVKIDTRDRLIGEGIRITYFIPAAHIAAHNHLNLKTRIEVSSRSFNDVGNSQKRHVIKKRSSGRYEFDIDLNPFFSGSHPEKQIVKVQTVFTAGLWQKTFENAFEIRLKLPNAEQRSALFAKAFGTDQPTRLCHEIFIPLLVQHHDHSPRQREIRRILTQISSHKATYALYQIFNRYPYARDIHESVSYNELENRLPVSKLPVRYTTGYHNYLRPGKKHSKSELKQLMEMILNEYAASNHPQNEHFKFKTLVFLAQSVPTQEARPLIQKILNCYLNLTSDAKARFDHELRNINSKLMAGLLYRIAEHQLTLNKIASFSQEQSTDRQIKLEHLLGITRTLLSDQTEAAQMSIAIEILKKWQSSDNGQLRALTAALICHVASPGHNDQLFTAFRTQSYPIMIRDKNMEVCWLALSQLRMLPATVDVKDIRAMIRQQPNVSKIHWVCAVAKIHGVNMDEVYREMIKRIRTLSDEELRYFLSFAFEPINKTLEYIDEEEMTDFTSKEHREQCYQAWDRFINQYGESLRYDEVKIRFKYTEFKGMSPRYE